MDKIKPKMKTAVAQFLDTLPEKISDSSENKFFKQPHTHNKQHEETRVCELPSGKKIRFVIKMLSPDKCRIWKGNIRLQDFVNEQTTLELKEKIEAQGQLVPVLARPIKGDSTYSHEIIYGSRRHFVCSSLGIDIKVLEGEIDDDDALLFMDAENSGRESPSIYETSIAYKHWLEDGIFHSQGELAKKMGITRVWVNKLLAISTIPKEIIQAFPNPKAVTLKICQTINKKISDDPKATNDLIKIASDLKTMKLDTQEFLDRLLTPGVLENKGLTKTSAESSLSKTIFSSSGAPICKISTSRSGKVMITISAKFSRDKVQSLLDQFETIVQKF